MEVMPRSLAAALTALVATTALAEPAGPGPELLETSQRLHQLLSTSADAGHDEAMRQLVTTFFDLEQMTRDALGDHWDDLDAAQQREVTALLRQLVEQAAIRQLHQGLDYHLELGAVTARIDRGRVEAIVAVDQGAEVSTVILAFHLRRQGRRWRVVDLEIDGARLVRGYRIQFHRLITSQGFGELLRRMRQRLDGPPP